MVIKTRGGVIRKPKDMVIQCNPFKTVRRKSKDGGMAGQVSAKSCSWLPEHFRGAGFQFRQ